MFLFLLSFILCFGLALPLVSDRMSAMNDNTYNGWKNYQTWNVALYIQDNENLYHLARKCKSYSHFLARAGIMPGEKTADGVSWHDSRISKREVSAMIKELNE